MIKLGDSSKFHFYEVRKIFLIALVSIIFFDCSKKCRDAVCNDHIFIGNVSGSKFVMKAEEFYDLDSLVFYRYGNAYDLKISKFDMTIFSWTGDLGEKKIFSSNSSYLTENMKNYLKENYPRFKKIVFSNFNVIDSSGQSIKPHCPTKIEIEFFPFLE